MRVMREQNKTAKMHWVSEWVMRVDPTDECCDLVLDVPYDRLVDLNQNVREDLTIPAKRSTKRVYEESEERARCEREVKMKTMKRERV